MDHIAPLVHSRTFEIDFRFLAIPAGLDAETRAWVDHHLESAMVYPEKLRQRVRWVFFRNDTYVVFGVICQNQMLAGSSDLQRFTKDFKGRDVYLFAGYMLKGNPQPGKLVPRRIELFSGLLRYVAKHWEEQSSSLPSRPEGRLQLIEEPFDLTVQDVAIDRGSQRTLNSYDDRVDLHSANESSDLDDALWASAFQSTTTTSLCLGLPGMKYAVEGVFMNATIEGGGQPRTILRTPAQPPLSQVTPARSYQPAQQYMAHEAYWQQRQQAAPPRDAEAYIPCETELVQQSKRRVDDGWNQARVGPQQYPPVNRDAELHHGLFARLRAFFTGEEPGPREEPYRMPFAERRFEKPNSGSTAGRGDESRGPSTRPPFPKR